MAIAAFGTMWLAGSRGDLQRLPQLADLVAFDSVAGIEPWLERLAADGVERLWLAVPGLGITGSPYGPVAPVSAGFLGGLPAGLVSAGTAGRHRWRGQWSPATRAGDGAQILVVNYLSEPVTVAPARIGTGEARAGLDEALDRAARFADRQQLPEWARLFAEARRPPEARRRDLFPASWPDPDGRALAATAMAAWVFGGMGSWNDLGFADGEAQREYEQISRDLLETVLRACIAAVNTDLR
jgi:hypothetical protein